MDSKDFVVIGIGSSAGGLEALQIVLSKVDHIDNCAFIIAQHLSPTHKSMMTDLLSRITTLPVIEIKNGMVIKNKTIYMTPENTDVYVSNGKIFLTNIEQTYGPKPSVNYFFNSLAQEYGAKAIGVILSGTGSDGAFGIRAIKANGGITIAQSPATSKYDGMPISAINTGKVDIVVPVDNISNELEKIVANIDVSFVKSLNEDISSQLFHLVFNEKGVDFSQYKKSTISRRIDRRLTTLKIKSLVEYIEYLKSHKEEIENLYNDILIGVTEFFRDQAVFDEINEQLKKIIEKKEYGDEIRLWCVGCSTGEEAYSLGILVSELLKDKISKYKIKIFATDIDEESLKIARAGIYAETSLVNVKKQYVQRYFTVQKNQFEVKKSIRELVIFSKHNIISDSPFLRIDMITCRNLLIYFNQNLQNRFFPIVHYALKDNGVLVLGKSESLGSNLDLFIPVHKVAKIFKAQYTGVKEPPKLYHYVNPYKVYDEKKEYTKRKNDEELLEEKIVEATMSFMMDKCVVINSSNEIVYLKGKIPYIEHAQGKNSNNIFKCINEELVLDLRSALNQTQKNKKIHTTPIHSIKLLDYVMTYVKIVVIPLQNDQDGDFLYILFFQMEENENINTVALEHTTENETIKKLKSELVRTKAHLQNVIEELETSYEEMQSLNEELSSSNEELQSTNEELETTNEELQSTNEELQTAYTELKLLYDNKEITTKQLEELTHKLQSQQNNMEEQQELTNSILETVPVGIVMLNNEGQLLLINHKAKKILHINTLDDMTHNQMTNLESLIFENLPFALIKKTHEPIYKIEHTIKVGNNAEIFITINGVPVFETNGEFIGVVFSILDSSEKYEKIIISNNKEQNISEEQLSDIMQLGLLDITYNLKNHINDLGFLIQSIYATKQESQAHKQIEKNINTILFDVNSILDNSIEYYQDLYFLDKGNFIQILKKYIKLFEGIFKSNNMIVQDDLKLITHFECKPKIGSIFILKLFSMLLDIARNEEKNLEIFISYDLKSKQLTLDMNSLHTPKIVFEQLVSNIDLTKLNEYSNDKNIPKIVLRDTNNKDLVKYVT